MAASYYCESPIGLLGILEEEGQLSGLFCAAGTDMVGIMGPMPAVIRETIKQLDEYFHAGRTKFEIPIRLKGTKFQQKVWAALQTIPYGETRSYREIAGQVGSPGACRAVGGANHANPIMIVVPCHRVIGADGSLTGFGGGLEAKQYLLELERKVIIRKSFVLTK